MEMVLLKELLFLAPADIPLKNNSVCTKIEPASSKINGMLEINVLQKFSLNALFYEFLSDFV